MKRILSVLIVSVIGILVCTSMGAKGDEPMFKEGEKIKVTGVLRLVGNEPFTRLSIRVTNFTKHEDIYLPEDLKKTYRVFIAREVEAEGTFHVETIYSGNHKYKIREYMLTNVTSFKKAEPAQ